MSDYYVTCEFCGDHDGFHTDQCPHSIRMGIENSKKLWKLQMIVKVELGKLEPWYKGGSVVDPMMAVEALRNIEKAVRQ